MSACSVYFLVNFLAVSKSCKLHRAPGFGFLRLIYGRHISSMDRQARRRRRPALSCLECRRRKIKCDRNDPCTNCTLNRCQCSFEPYSNEPVPITRQQPYLGTQWPATSSPSSSVAPATKQYSTSSAPVDSGTRLPNRSLDKASPDIRDLLNRVQKLEDASVSSPVNSLSEADVQDSQVTLNKTRMLGSSHRLGWGGEVKSSHVSQIHT